ncbi:kinase [Kitasatospora sp. NPDC057223]|uniref:GHMP family kinase ATP-binding protein n=1 Tax=Kitasatospora sp. NPDC057223 TaxID=3346055 RepID=UPI00364497D5
MSFGTFGELLQGALAGPDEDFLVTLPIARWSTAQVTLTPGADGLRVEPAGKLKALRVARSVLARHGDGDGDGGTLVLSGDLPEGKGMSSSSADLVATVRAVADALGITLPPQEIETYLRGIEPTDGLMYSEVVAFHHRKVRLCRTLGPVPPMTIVGVDEGGQVDTVDFNASRPVVPAAERGEYGVLLDGLATALAGGDLAAVGRISTRSAELNQARCHKRHLDRMLEIRRDIGALGVAVAHSGTMVGLLISGADAGYDGKLADAVAAGTELAGTVSVDHTLSVPAPRRYRGARP